MYYYMYSTKCSYSIPPCLFEFVAISIVCTVPCCRNILLMYYTVPSVTSTVDHVSPTWQGRQHVADNCHPLRLPWVTVVGIYPTQPTSSSDLSRKHFNFILNYLALCKKNILAFSQLLSLHKNLDKFLKQHNHPNGLLNRARRNNQLNSKKDMC